MKKGLLLIILVLEMLLVGCGKEKETEITSENAVSEIKNENIDIEKLIDEFYTNEKYSQKINGVTCFNPEYKELIFETFAKSNEQKSYSLTFVYKDEKELEELEKYVEEFNKKSEIMKLQRPFDEDIYLKRISYILDYPNKK
ncbi:hypothetical protein KSU09_05185 [Fusobacterium nucleatum]|uniref:hypothetical protein n=1 Tax=Fusobacterium nucleatum TaxID=851 RepID=UPI0030D23C8E